MSNFYDKRFLSSLVGALTVLGSPVASAGKNGSGRGDLGKGVHSASRDKNNGNLGGLKSNREVKSVDGLKKVLKETGGKVVRVSPDGKGGFVAFVKTPTGKVVTVAVVGVPLIAIIALLVVLYRRKGNKGSGKIINESEIKDGSTKVENKHENGDIKGETILDNIKKENLENDDGPSDDDLNIDSKALLSQLFKNDKDKYDSFVKKLLEVFFNNDNKNEDLDEYLKSVFERSFFQNNNVIWYIKGCTRDKYHVDLNSNKVLFRFEGAGDSIVDFFKIIFEYLRDKGLVRVRIGQPSALWGYRISAVLFGFWFLVEYGFEPGSSAVKGNLEAGNFNEFKKIFNVISNYVGGRLKAAGRGYNGQKLDPVN